MMSNQPRLCYHFVFILPVMTLMYAMTSSPTQAQIVLKSDQLTMYFKDDGIGVNWWARKSKLPEKDRPIATKAVLLYKYPDMTEYKLADEIQLGDKDNHWCNFFHKREIVVDLRIEYKIQIQDNHGKVLLSYPFITKIPKPKIKPFTPTPTGLKVQLITEGENRYLQWSWDKAKDDDQYTDSYWLSIAEDNGKNTRTHKKVGRDITSEKHKIHSAFDDTWYCWITARPKEQLTWSVRDAKPTEKVKVFIPGSYVERVQNLKAVHDYTQPGIVTLTWEHPEIDRLKGFQIFDRNKRLIDETQCPATQTQWVFKNVPLNSLHQYHVKAVTKYGFISLESIGGGQVNVRDTPPGSPPRQPNNLSYQWLEDKPEHVLIKWEQTKDAMNYLIQSTSPKTNGYGSIKSELIATQETQHIFKLDPEQEHVVHVMGVDQYDRQGRSAYISVLQPGIHFTAPYFSIKTTKNDDGSKTYKLYWRLLPNGVATDELAGFEISCNGTIIVGQDILNADVMEHMISSNTLEKGRYKYSVRVIQKDGQKCNWSYERAIRIR